MDAREGPSSAEEGRNAHDKKRFGISHVSGMPMKRVFRQRAHANPMSDGCFGQPLCPAHMDWSELYPALKEDGGAEGRRSGYKGDGKVRFVDVGCGFGGMLIELGKHFPDTLSLGMEIRSKVSKYVEERIISLRGQAVESMRGNREGGSSAGHPHYQNVAVIRTNTMKYLLNYFEKGQLEKLFFLFADPHFKKKNHRR